MEDGVWSIQVKNLRDRAGNYFGHDEDTGEVYRFSWNITLK